MTHPTRDAAFTALVLSALDERLATPRSGRTARRRSLEALRRGALAEAAARGVARLKQMPDGHWTLRLFADRQAEAFEAALAAFGGQEPDLFLLPWNDLPGQPVYNLCLGEFATLEAAQLAARSLPAPLAGAMARPVRASRVPGRQQHAA